MMIAVYIIIGVTVGAVVLYLLMDRRMDTLRIEGGKKDIELSMKGEQLNAATSRVNHLEAENKTLHAKAERKRSCSGVIGSSRSRCRPQRISSRSS